MHERDRRKRRAIEQCVERGLIGRQGLPAAGMQADVDGRDQQLRVVRVEYHRGAHRLVAGLGHVEHAECVGQADIGWRVVRQLAQRCHVLLHRLARAAGAEQRLAGLGQDGSVFLAACALGLQHFGGTRGRTAFHPALRDKALCQCEVRIN
jgi:hypothetical protein